MYKLIPDHFVFGPVDAVLRVLDHTYIPFDPDNTDYQAYLKWLAEGNQPLPADEGTPSA